MSFAKTIANILRKPFPMGERRPWYYRSLLILSLFVSVFLYIYKPFGMHQLSVNTLFICFGFGGMTFLGGALYELLLHQFRKYKKSKYRLTFGKWSLNNLGAMLLISLTNFLFARFIFFGYIDWSLYPVMLYATFMIGIIPLTFISLYVLINQKNQQKPVPRIVEQKSLVNQDSQFLFEIPLEQIKYIEALQNYVKIAFINNVGQLKIRTERATLKQMQIKIEGSTIIKCHRSYLVNTKAIIYTEGNSQGLALTLSDCDTIIPVSRTWVPLFRKN